MKNLIESIKDLDLAKQVAKQQAEQAAYWHQRYLEEFNKVEELLADQRALIETMSKNL